jgi:hypothetical protein
MAEPERRAGLAAGGRLDRDTAGPKDRASGPGCGGDQRVVFCGAQCREPSTAAHNLALRWLAVPVGLVWAALLCWRSVRMAVARLENCGPEIFARVRAPAS